MLPVFKKDFNSMRRDQLLDAIVKIYNEDENANRIIELERENKELKEKLAEKPTEVVEQVIVPDSSSVKNYLTEMIQWMRANPVARPLIEWINYYTTNIKRID